MLEIIICGELRLEFIRSDKIFCEQYDVDPELFEKVKTWIQFKKED